MNDQAACLCSWNINEILPVSSLCLSTNHYGNMFVDLDAYPYAQDHCLIIQKKKNQFKSSSAIISFFPVLSALRFCSKQVFWLLFLGAEGTHAFLITDVAISVMLNSRVCRRKPLLSLGECESWSFYFCIEVSIWEGLESIKSIVGHNFIRFTFGSLYFLS